MFDENNKQQRDVLYFIPPKPIREFQYSCDKKFRIELIEDLYEKYEDYGILYLSGYEYTFYVMNGKDLFEVTKTTRKRLPRTHKRGGQSQNRIARLRDEAIHNYLTKINEEALDLFIDTETSLPKIKGLVIIGSGNKKTQFTDRLDVRLQDILLGTFTSEELDVEIAFKTINNFIKNKDTKLVSTIINDESKLEYGEKDVLQAIDDGYIEIVIITPKMKESLDNKNIDIKQKCQDMSTTLYVIDDYNVESMCGIIAKRWW